MIIKHNSQTFLLAYSILLYFRKFLIMPVFTHFPASALTQRIFTCICVIIKILSARSENLRLYTLILILLFVNFLSISAAEYTDDFLQHGINAYENGDFDKAIELLDIAVIRLRDSNLVTAYKYLALANIGKGQIAEAEEAFKMAIRLNPGLALNPDEYSSKVLNLFQRVRDGMVRTLTIISVPTNSTVFVDDKRAGITSQDAGVLKLDALVGRHYIKVSRRYFEEKTVQVDVSKNGENTVKIALKPIKIGLWIQTNPKYANLYVNDKFAGTTPITIDSTMGAKLTVKLTKRGYRDKIMEIRLKNAPFSKGGPGGFQEGVAEVGNADVPLINEMAHISINLEALPPGQLKIVSDPTGADVYLDDELKGKTPLTLDNVAVGEHRLRFHLEQFNDVIQSVRVISDKTSKVEGKLGGAIKVTSFPPGADVYLDQTHIGNTPLVTARVPQRRHYLKLRMRGYADEVREVITTSSIVEIQVRLMRKTGSLAVNSNPMGATVFLDGERRGIASAVLYGLPVGKHQLKLTKTGYGEWMGQIQIKQREITWKNVYLRRNISQ